MNNNDNITKLNAIAELDKIFKIKQWEEYQFKEFVYSNFCNLLTHLNSYQIELILSLTQNYIWLTANECQYYFFELLKKFEKEENLSNIKKIILFPIMKINDEDKTKSGHVMLYTLRAMQPYLNTFGKIKIEEIECYTKLEEYNFSKQDDELLFLVDDFLGTSETISETILEVCKNKTLSNKNIHVFSIAAQIESIEYLKEHNILLHNHFNLKKGMSDYFSGSDLDEKKKIMAEIEDVYLNGVGNYRFGYLKSEALITLLRTPDNTFPIFWKDFEVKKIKHKAPFSRY